MDNEEQKNDSRDAVQSNAGSSAQVVTATSVKADDVPTLPLGPLQTISELRPEITIHAVASTRSANLPAPLVEQPTEYHRSMGDWIQIWWDGIRPPYLTLSLVPLCVGTMLAWIETITTSTPLGRFHLAPFLGAIIVVLLLQVGGQLINDYYDYMRGIDRSNLLGPGGLIQQGLVKPTRVLMVGMTLLVLGALLGLFVAFAGGAVAYLFGLIGVLCAYLYSATSRALSSLALGELVAFLIFGPLITLGAYMIQMGSMSRTAFIYSIPLGLLAAAVVHVNNMRDIEGDSQSGKLTIASMLGMQWSRAWFLVLLVAAYVIIVVLGISHSAPHWLLITLWTLPALVVIISGILRTDNPAGFHLVMRQVLKLEVIFGMLLIVGLLIAALIPVLPHFPVLPLIPAIK
jgi:1,4-dihydroxy-2-naphthoate polyprenyltransferase